MYFSYCRWIYIVTRKEEAEKNKQDLENNAMSKSNHTAENGGTMIENDTEKDDKKNTIQT